MSRVRMPHNNRMSASTALKTNDMWSKTIGHDPYAAGAQQEENANLNSEVASASLMLLAKMSNLSGAESRGGCKKCGQLGHLTFQCRNNPVEERKDGSDSSSDVSDDDSSLASGEGRRKSAAPSSSTKAPSNPSELKHSSSSRNDDEDRKKRKHEKKEKSKHKHKHKERKHRHKESSSSSKEKSSKSHKRSRRDDD